MPPSHYDHQTTAANINHTRRSTEPGSSILKIIRPHTERTLRLRNRRRGHAAKVERASHHCRADHRLVLACHLRRSLPRLSCHSPPLLGRPRPHPALRRRWRRRGRRVYRRRRCRGCSDRGPASPPCGRTGHHRPYPWPVYCLHWQGDRRFASLGPWWSVQGVGRPFLPG